MFGGAELPLLWAVVFIASLAESALRFASRARLEEEIQGHRARARYVRYLEQSRALMAFCVLARVVAATLLVAIIVLRGHRAGGPVAVSLLAAAALLAAAEWPARLMGRKWSSGALRIFLPLLYWGSSPLRLLPGWGRRPAPGQEERPEPEVVDAAKEEIRVAIEDGAAEGALRADEREMIEGIMKFRDVDVGQIMTPRPDMECLAADLPVPEAARALAECRHSRIPVYERTLDSILGIVYVKDLLAAMARDEGAGAVLRDVMREPLFVPETKTVGSLLQQFQQEHVQIAVVLDEYGGVAGLVSVEDIMEEIVGEIQDEYDQEDHEGRVRRRSSGGVEVDGRVRIDELNDLMGARLPEDDDYDTVGGYVTARLSHVPKPGEEFRAHGLIVRVLQSDERRVRRVFLRRI